MECLGVWLYDMLECPPIRPLALESACFPIDQMGEKLPSNPDTIDFALLPDLPVGHPVEVHEYSVGASRQVTPNGRWQAIKVQFMF